jgi:hypothetical protein
MGNGNKYEIVHQTTRKPKCVGKDWGHVKMPADCRGITDTWDLFVEIPAEKASSSVKKTPPAPDDITGYYFASGEGIRDHAA